MKNIMKTVLQKSSFVLITTAIALLVLSIVALFYGGSMICISTVFEIFLICCICQLVLWLIENIDCANVWIEITCRYATVIIIVIAGGYIFHWIDNLPPIILGAMAIIIYFLSCAIEIYRVKSEIKTINELARKHKND